MSTASQVALLGKNLFANEGDVRLRFNPWVWKIPSSGGMANHSSVLPWRIPWTEEPGGLQSIGSQSRKQLKCDLARTQRLLHCQQIL